MEIRGGMGAMVRLSEWIMRLSMANLLWILCSLPFIFLMASIVMSELKHFLITLFIAAAVAPFTLFPATAAVFTVCRKWIMGEEEGPVIKSFFRGYKENYVHSMFGGLIYVALSVILYVNYHFYAALDNLFSAISLILLLLFLIMGIAWFHFFSLTVHFHMNLLQALKNSVFLTVGSPIYSLMMAVCNLLIIYISLKWTFMIFFFTGSLISVVSFWSFLKMCKKMENKFVR